MFNNYSLTAVMTTPMSEATSVIVVVRVFERDRTVATHVAVMYARVVTSEMVAILVTVGKAATVTNDMILSKGMMPNCIDFRQEHKIG